MSRIFYYRPTCHFCEYHLVPFLARKSLSVFTALYIPLSRVARGKRCSPTWIRFSSRTVPTDLSNDKGKEDIAWTISSCGTTQHFSPYPSAYIFPPSIWFIFSISIDFFFLFYKIVLQDFIEVCETVYDSSLDFAPLRNCWMQKDFRFFKYWYREIFCIGISYTFDVFFYFFDRRNSTSGESVHLYSTGVYRRRLFWIHN